MSQDDLDAGRTALAMAERLGATPLLVDALGALQALHSYLGDFREALDMAARRSELLDQIRDPDRAADMLMMNADLYLTTGRLAEARVMVQHMEEVVAGLTPHHRIHGLGMHLLFEEATADWGAARQLTKRTEDLVETNLATPCPFNVMALTILATGWTHAHGTSESARLLARADEIGMRSYAEVLAPHWLNLAIAQDDRVETRRLIDSIEPAWFGSPFGQLWAVLFDGLVLLDDRERIEADAPQWLDKDVYTTPFAMRALAVTRGDEALLEDAAARFDAMGLVRPAGETRAMRVRLPGSDRPT
jgi:cob(I)alamin adenosyltransferase